MSNHRRTARVPMIEYPAARAVGVDRADRVLGLRFGSFELDCGAHRLSRNGQSIHVTPKAFALLCLLVQGAPNVVSKDRIHDRLWPNYAVTDATLFGLVKELRRALNDNDRKQRKIRTVHRVGYAFDVHVDVVEEADSYG